MILVITNFNVLSIISGSLRLIKNDLEHLLGFRFEGDRQLDHLLLKLVNDMAFLFHRSKELMNRYMLLLLQLILVPSHHLRFIFSNLPCPQFGSQAF